MAENDGRKVAGHLPKIVVEGAPDPVVQVVSEADGDILYTRRIQGSSFLPPVYAPGKYTIKIGRDRPDTVLARGVTLAAAGAAPLPAKVK
jgi:hypothetical protein